MSIPHADRAAIDPAKIRDYLLSPTHPIGHSKAQVFRRLGYEASKWTRLRDDLRGLLLRTDVVTQVPSPYGAKYVATGILEGPNGRTMLLTTVWIVTSGETVPRLVTAYPGDAP